MSLVSNGEMVSHSGFDLHFPHHERYLGIFSYTICICTSLEKCLRGFPIWGFRIFLKMFWEAQWQDESEVSSFYSLIPCMLAIARVRPGRGQKPGTPSGFPTWVAGTQVSTAIICCLPGTLARNSVLSAEWPELESGTSCRNWPSQGPVFSNWIELESSSNTGLELLYPD